MRQYLVPIVLTYALFAWWGLGLIVYLPIFPPPEHVPNAIGYAAVFNCVLALFVAFTWIMCAVFGKRW